MNLDDQIHAVDVSVLWPLSAQWRVIARWNQALNVARNLETLAGFEYDDCCWAVRAVARNYRVTALRIPMPRQRSTWSWS